MSKEQDHAARLRRGVVELAVLALLRERPRYGQQLVEDLSQRPALALSAGTVYPLVSRLLKDGLIASTWQESPVGPPRKYYRLTSEGSRALAEMTRAWNALRTDVDALVKETP
ncbi:PadR family transcriptional regulator [Brachybacterium muris]|uniref:PadR family transcriptional regulator n=1 Tax=Brachybacterium muris TaxID=219301 RepID=UPI00223BDADE|nr:PadR family transcriptional regulator [Brachybacterium muris]MCT2261298.1 PadR family transcriptional regulator [Brachybacterium muris]